MVPAFAFEVGRSSLEIGEKKHFPPSTKIETNKTNWSKEKKKNSGHKELFGIFYTIVFSI